MKITARELAQMIDHTFLKANGTEKEIDKLCSEAAQWNFATVMVHPCAIERCVQFLSGTSVKVGSVAGFPLGSVSSTTKAFEVRDCIDRGAQEVDMVINVGAVISGDENYVRAELENLAEACAEAGVISKIILENCYLSDEQKRWACRIAVEAGVDFVKTSTGFGSGGATAADVRLMAQAVGARAQVKAAGGIRSYADALAMIEAGAKRIGASCGVAIVTNCESDESA